MRKTMSLLALVAACTLATSAVATDAFTDAVQASYAPYRPALFRTNGKSQPEAAQAVGQAPPGLGRCAGPPRRRPARAGALDHLARRPRKQAPEALRANADFAALQRAVEEASAGLTQALVRQDAAAARDALGKLKRPYSQLFLKFG